jgi:hypothetical protein
MTVPLWFRDQRFQPFPEIIRQNGAGHKKPIQTTPQVGNCSTLTPQIRIAVSALLELARWCQARQEAFQGGDPCQASHDDLFPPARSEPKQDNSANAVLGATPGKQSKNARADSRADDRPAAPSTHKKGGKR